MQGVFLIKRTLFRASEQISASLLAHDIERLSSRLSSVYTESSEYEEFLCRNNM